MDDQRQGDGGEDGAARAFAQLGREVSLLRSAIEGLTAAREAIEMPDYEPTLKRTETVLGVLVQQINAMGKSPALTLTPENMGQRINAAVADATRELEKQIGSADTMLRNAARDLSARAALARTGDEQNWWLLWTWLSGLVLGLLFYAVLAGPLVRATPDSWLWPEKMATRVLDEPTPWDAAERLMRASNPEGWTAIVAGAAIVRDNRQAIESCRKASKAEKIARCTIDVKATGE